MRDVRGFLQRLFAAGVTAAQAEHVLPDFLPQPPPGRTLVLGAGRNSGRERHLLLARCLLRFQFRLRVLEPLRLAQPDNHYRRPPAPPFFPTRLRLEVAPGPLAS